MTIIDEWEIRSIQDEQDRQHQMEAWETSYIEDFGLDKWRRVGGNYTYSNKASLARAVFDGID